MNEDLREQMTAELDRILAYWMQYVPRQGDDTSFYGAVDNHNNPVRDAPQGLVMYARILWAFSEAHSLVDPTWIAMADRSYGYLLSHFQDKEYGGLL